MEDFKENGSVTAEEDEQGSTTDSSRIEKSKLVIMRAFVEREDPSSKDVDDCTLRRFLRARDLEVEKASKMFLKHLIWRRSFVPNGSITLPEITNEVVQNKLFVQGHDKKGRPLMVVFGNRHRPSMSNLDEFKRFIVYALDTICSRVSPGEEKFVAIADLQGWGYSNSDIRGYITALSILQSATRELAAVINIVPLFVARIFIGLGFSVIYVGVVLLELVVQTALYFVCKSFYHESIDKVSSEYNKV